MRVHEIEIIGGEDKGKVKEFKLGCQCEEKELVKQSMKRYKKGKARKLKRIFDEKSLINRDLDNASFESYVAENEKQEFAKRISERYVEVFDIDKPMNLLFYGDYGIGKSHLAKSIADGVIEKGNTAIFIKLPMLLRNLRSTYNNQSELNEDEIMSALIDADLLVLDDLGVQNSSNWATEKIYDLVDSRQGKHTIYTTNYDPDDLLVELGEREFSRIVNHQTTIVEVEGKNKRLEKFNKRAENISN